MKLLLTAFDPFGGEKINPALEAVKRVQDKIGDLEIVKLEVPTVFYKSIDTVANAIEKEHPYQSKQWLLKLEKQIFLQVFLIQQELMYVTI